MRAGARRNGGLRRYKYTCVPDFTGGSHNTKVLLFLTGAGVYDGYPCPLIRTTALTYCNTLPFIARILGQRHQKITSGWQTVL